MGSRSLVVASLCAGRRVCLRQMAHPGRNGDERRGGTTVPGYLDARRCCRLGRGAMHGPRATRRSPRPVPESPRANTARTASDRRSTRSSTMLRGCHRTENPSSRRFRLLALAVRRVAACGRAIGRLAVPNARALVGKNPPSLDAHGRVAHGTSRFRHREAVRRGIEGGERAARLDRPIFAPVEQIWREDGQVPAERGRSSIVMFIRRRPGWSPRPSSINTATRWS